MRKYICFFLLLLGRIAFCSSPPSLSCYEGFQAGDFARIVIEYPLPEGGIKAGGSLVLLAPHPLAGVMTEPIFNIDKSDAPSYVQAFANEMPLKLEVFYWGNDLALRARTKEDVAEGRIKLILGEKTQGSPGFPLPTVAGRYPFRLFLDKEGKGEFADYGQVVELEVKPNHFDHLRLLPPSIIQPQKEFELLIVALDRYGNPLAPNQIDEEKFRLFLEKYPFDREEIKQISRFSVSGAEPRSIRLKVAENGAYRLVAISEKSYAVRFYSHPFLVGDYPFQIFWADLHGHTENSDGMGTAEDYFRFAAKVSLLDAVALTDHRELLSQEEWLDMLKIAQKASDQYGLIIFPGFETQFPGDHIFYFPPISSDKTKKLAQKNFLSLFPSQNPLNFLINRPQSFPLVNIPSKSGKSSPGMFQFSEMVKIAKKVGDFILVPHTTASSNMGDDLEHYFPAFTPLIEVFSTHGSSWGERANYPLSRAMESCTVQSYLQLGYPLGFLACGDSHDCRPGDTRWGRYKKNGLTAILAQSKGGKELYQALKNRNTYATTSSRTILVATLNGKPPGSILDRADIFDLNLIILAENPAQEVVLFSQREAIFHLKPEKELVKIQHRFTATSGFCYLYARMAGGEELWASPWYLGKVKIPQPKIDREKDYLIFKKGQKVEIPIVLEKEGLVELKIASWGGWREIKTIKKHCPPGRNVLVWDQRDEKNNPVELNYFYPGAGYISLLNYWIKIDGKSSSRRGLVIVQR